MLAHPVVEVADGDVPPEEVDQRRPIFGRLVNVLGVDHAAVLGVRVHHEEGHHPVGHRRDEVVGVGRPVDAVFLAADERLHQLGVHDLFLQGAAAPGAHAVGRGGRH